MLVSNAGSQLKRWGFVLFCFEFILNICFCSLYRNINIMYCMIVV